MLKTLSALCALAAASALVLPTVSQAEETQSVRVSYADLNLASGADQDELQQRIGDAAKFICEGDLTNIDFVPAVFECRLSAVAGAQPAFQAAVAQSTRRGNVIVGSAAGVLTVRSA